MSASVIAERFGQVARDHRDAAAVRVLPDGRAISFADLRSDFSTMSRAFAAAGLDRASAIVSLVGNRPEFFPLFAACMDVGAALIPLGDATDAEVAALIQRAGASAVVVERPMRLRATRELALPGGLRLLRLADPAVAPEYGESVVLKLTSGSTDLPKAAIAPERCLVNDGRHIIEAMGITRADVNFGCIPLSHSYGLGNLVMPLLWQGTSVALRRSFNPAQFVEDVAVSQATIFPGVPFVFERMKALGLTSLPVSLRLLITAGARIDPATVRWTRRHLDRKLHSFYGSSETGGIAYDDSDEVSDPLDVGRAMPETKVTIRVSDHAASDGRIFVAGNAVASGYARAGADAVAQFFEGGFVTGDLGHFDDHGRLFLTGRASPLVNVAGRKVDPAEVERALVDLPGISDARVFGMRSDTRGQEVVAFIVRSDDSLTPLAIRQRCAMTLSTYKIPRRFVFVDRFPVDPRGKVDCRALEVLAAEKTDVLWIP